MIIEEVELRKPLAGEVVVKIRASGICHSDLSVQNGLIPVPMPVIMGHEGTHFSNIEYKLNKI
jgi:Zn-dependent alcohol dehydrogenase